MALRARGASVSTSISTPATCRYCIPGGLTASAIRCKSGAVDGERLHRELAWLQGIDPVYMAKNSESANHLITNPGDRVGAFLIEEASPRRELIQFGPRKVLSLNNLLC